MKPVERQASPQAAKARRSVDQQRPVVKQPRRQNTGKEQPSAAAAEAMQAISSAMLTHSARTIEEICKYTGLTSEIIKASFIEHGATEDQIKQLAVNYTPPKATASSGQLSKREQEIITLLRLGYSSKLIAHELKIATSSVKVYIRRILEKLNVNSVIEVRQLYRELDDAERSALAGREIEVLKSLIAGMGNKEIVQRHGLSESNVKVHVRSALIGKKSDGPKATLLVEPPPIGDHYDRHSVNFEKSAPSLYDDNLKPIEKIINELAGWDKETLIVLAEKAANGALREWLRDQNSHANELSDRRPRATDPGMAASSTSSDASGQREPLKLQSNRDNPPDGQMYATRADRKETAPAFIERVYGGAGWLTGNFTRADLRKIDPDAAMGLANWEKNHQKRANLNLPTKQEANDRLLASGAPIETDDPRETARRRSAAWRRQQLRT